MGVNFVVGRDAYERFGSSFGLPKDFARRRVLEIREREEGVTRLRTLLQGFLSLQAPNPRTVSEIAVELAGAILHMEPPQIVEIRADEHLDKNGFAIVSSLADNRIGVRFQGRCACRITRTVAHETQHRYQAIKERFEELLGAGQAENDAEHFAEDFFKRFDLANRCPCVR